MGTKPTYEELEQRVKELEQEAVLHERAEEALREGEKRFRRIVEDTEAGYFFVDQEGRFMDVNEAWLRMHGFSSRDEAIGQHFSITQVDEDLEAAQRIVERLLRGNTIPAGAFSRRCKDGSVGYHIFSASPVESGGKIMGLKGFLIDVTEHRVEEEDLHQSNGEWEKAFNSISDWVCIIDLNSRILRTNVAGKQFVKVPADKMYGETCCKLVHGSDKPIAGCPLQRMLKTHQRETVELQTPDGLWLMVTADPVTNKEGQLVGAVHIIRDVTHRKRVEQEKKILQSQLQHAQKLEAIGTLAGGVAHDFNNLLMGIQGNVALILLDIASTSPHYKRLKNIEKQVKSGAELTAQLLGYARKGRYVVRPIKLNQLVRETSESFGRTRKDITIHRQLAENLFEIKADQGQIEQVLFNLFLNAGGAMSRGGDLILKTDNVTHEDMKGKPYEPKPGNYVMLTVTDTGMGMDNETMERVFNPFFTTKEMGRRGVGLGLASSYGIIKGHGGYIDVESEKGYGATFKIYLPASEKKVLKVVKTAEEIIEGTGTALLVDDEDVVLEVGRDLLEAIGYRVLIARDGKEAIEVYEKNGDNIDIVVLDMIMPRMGGGEAYDRMRKINPGIKVLLSSGYSIDGEATEILERGCDAFIQKPFTIKDLSQAIRKILGKK